MLKGGYKIIDLLSMSLVAGTVGGDYTEITDTKVIEQLLSLKDYLDADRKLKPILLRAKNSGGIETVYCELAKVVSEAVLYINAILMSYSLTIKIEYAKDEETEEIYIDDASYLYVANSDETKAVIEGASSGTIVNVLGLDGDGELVKGVIPNVENAESGTVVNVLGLDGDGELVKQEGTIKKIYWHSVYFERKAEGVHYFNGFLILLNNSSVAITKETFLAIIQLSGFYGLVIHGFNEQTNGAMQPTASSVSLVALKGTGTGIKWVRLDANNVIEETSEANINPSQWYVTDYGTNPIN